MNQTADRDEPAAPDWRLSDFDFELPESLIAQSPLPERSQSRLLQVPADGDLLDQHFGQLPQLLSPGDLLVMNDTRVIQARLHGQRVETGGRIEVLVERLVDERCILALVRASHRLPPATRLQFGRDASLAQARVLERCEDLYRIEFEEPAAAVLERLGEMPLPPYIGAQPGRDDQERYQTVYARVPGAVAAPTAGLHFDEALLAELKAQGISLATLTLHVGAGTFQPVRHDRVSEHRMHAERFEIPQTTANAIARTRASGGRVIAVGTTTLRALESTGGAAGEDETRLFIVPGFRFTVVDRLITNFHLPRSTLLMLVSAFAGVERIREAYRHAIADRYRFFSYGDAMLLDRAP